MAKKPLYKVEASIQTKGRFRDGSGRYVFIVYDAISNNTIHESSAYTTRFTAKRGAIRFFKREGMKLTLWIK